jgi:oligoendopeptidase F
MQQHEQALGSPSWDLSPEYSSFDDERFLADFERAKLLLARLGLLRPRIEEALGRAEDLDPTRDAALLAGLGGFLATQDELEVLFSNIRTYASCVSSVDGQDARAKEYRGLFSSFGASIEREKGALDLLLARVGPDFLRAFLELPGARGHGFRIALLRKEAKRLLDLPVEAALTTMCPDGLHAWGRLYDAITGSARCRLKADAGEKEIGVSEAASLLKQGDRGLREAAFRAQTETLALHEESLAAILNAIAGWRLSEYGLRSKKEPLHFLDAALSSNRLERRSLDAMLTAVTESRELGRRALRLQARLMGLPRLSCFDLLAPCPSRGGGSAVYRFEEGLELVRGAYAAVHPTMGDFVLEMRDRGRIEARILPTKRPGAYCTRFLKTRTPRVFMSYGGSLGDVSTLAHELGHAYHGSLLAALPVAEAGYPMNLAETASTFAETALGDYLSASPTTPRERLLEVAWGDAQDAATFLLNIPVRFAFEKAFYEARAEKPLGAAALSALMRSTWEEWYGDSLDEVDPGFWRSKLHFFMSGLSFYNFPYTFGYLFSLGVYARREPLGEGFHDAYKALLMDTGRMESEELARRHLGVDLGEPEFWRSSIAIVGSKLDRFEGLIEETEAARA